MAEGWYGTGELAKNQNSEAIGSITAADGRPEAINNNRAMNKNGKTGHSL